MKVHSIHPFPARMAPDLALLALRDLPAGSIVLDPMMGSGTVVRHSLDACHEAVGCDVDPLSVIMTRAWTTQVLDEDIGSVLEDVLDMARQVGDTVPSLAWQHDPETLKFIDYWFFARQRGALARVAYAIHHIGGRPLTSGRVAALDVLRVAFSRIIITKEQGASLARDTSHSRPHRVATTSDYDVLSSFTRSVAQLRKRLAADPPRGKSRVGKGDARALALSDASVDAVITSPPYLNAIDYMRGHRMSLVWLGYSVPALRSIRSSSIGAERSAGRTIRGDEAQSLAALMRGPEPLQGRLEGIIGRYALDLIDMTAEVSRVLKPGRRATFVVGNSCIKGSFINNATGVACAAERAGMIVVGRRERDLPQASRYLPVSGERLSKRIRTETVLVCRKAS